MRELIVNTFLTLDGVMQAPGGPEEDPSGGFEHGGWSVNYWDEVMMETMAESTERPFDMVLGRKTYEIFAAHWPHAEEQGAEFFNEAAKHVASRTLETTDWQNSSLIGDDVVAAVRELKEADGPELHVNGSWDLLQTLLPADLIDEFRLWIFPLTVGPGKRLFADGTVPHDLKLVGAKLSTTGVFLATYRTAGDVEVGSFALETPDAAEIERREKRG